MKGYSKIKLMNSCSTKSRSMDFSDETITAPRIQNPILIKKSTITITQHPPKKPDADDDDDDDYKRYSDNHQEEDGNFPTKMLTKNRSVASRNDEKNASRRLKIEKQNSTGATLQTAVKRVLSIGRSSSVSERYSRIHDQYANSIDDHHHHHEEEEEEMEMGRSENKMKKQRSHNKGGVLRACKRIFGF